MKSLYIYPTYTPEKDKTGNKYIKYFHDSFSKEYAIKNRHGKLGIAGLFFNLSADCFIFHWVDLIITKQKGHIQVFLFLFGIFLLKAMRKKVIWVLHNKKPHRVNSRIALFCMRYIAHHADIIITHSKEGLTFIEAEYGSRILLKTTYLPHPVYSTELIPTTSIVWDIIIWGTIEKYKNVLAFIEFVKANDEFLKKKILICGRCPDKEYAREIVSSIPDNITFVNEFIEDSQLRDFISKSKVILFTYSLDSVLSSGALIYSLNFNKKIIGPLGGAFKDFRPIVECYEGFEDLLSIDFEGIAETTLINEYLKDNTWDALPIKVADFLNVSMD